MAKGFEDRKFYAKEINHYKKTPVTSGTYANIIPKLLHLWNFKKLVKKKKKEKIKRNQWIVPIYVFNFGKEGYVLRGGTKAKSITEIRLLKI